MGTTGFVFPNDVHVSWSIMIVLYPYITGLVAGAFVVSALYYVFRLDVFRPVARLALVTSLCFCMFATLPLLLHLHHPERAFNIMITPSTTSAMACFGFIYNLYLLLLVLEVWLVFRPAIVERAKSGRGVTKILYRILSLGATKLTPGARALDQRMIRYLAIAGIPMSCILTGDVGFLFGAVKANPWWSTALIPVIFLVSAIISGFAALIVLYLFLCWRRGVKADVACVQAMARNLWLFLILAFSLEMLELGHLAYEASGEWPILAELLSQHLAVSYGLIQVLLGSICPFVLLLFAIGKQRNPRLLSLLSGISGLLVLVQVFAMRWNVVIGGQLFSKSFRGFVEYTVPWGGREGLIAAAIVLALPLLALWVALHLLPIWQESEA